MAENMIPFDSIMPTLTHKEIVAYAMLLNDFDTIQLVANVLLEGTKEDIKLGKALLTICDRMVECSKGDVI